MLKHLKIVKCEPKDGPKGTFYIIGAKDEAEDEWYNGSSNDLWEKGKSFDVELKPSREYNGKQQYYFNWPKGQKTKEPEKSLSTPDGDDIIKHMLKIEQWCKHLDKKLDEIKKIVAHKEDYDAPEPPEDDDPLPF